MLIISTKEISLVLVLVLARQVLVLELLVLELALLGASLRNCSLHFECDRSQSQQFLPRNASQHLRALSTFVRGRHQGNGLSDSCLINSVNNELSCTYLTLQCIPLSRRAA